MEWQEQIAMMLIIFYTEFLTQVYQAIVYLW